MHAVGFGDAFWPCTRIENHRDVKPMVIALVAFAVLGAGAVWTVRALHRDEPPSSTKAIEPTPVAPRKQTRFVKATGVIKPRVGAEVRVGSRISGVVNRLQVKVGDSVNKGDLLAELDDRDLVARREQAQAELQRSLAELRFADADLKRQNDLREQKVISTSDWDVAQRAHAVAEQQVAVARAALVYAETQVAYARIYAPISGVVASISTQEGETVAASFSAPTFVTLIDLSRLEVWAYVDETDIGRVEPGRNATFTVDTYREEAFPGVVTTIYPKAEIRDNVVDYVTVVSFAPPARQVLRPEMTTTVQIALPPETNSP